MRTDVGKTHHKRRFGGVAQVVRVPASQVCDWVQTPASQNTNKQINEIREYKMNLLFCILNWFAV
jgi:hypothetical protein